MNVHRRSQFDSKSYLGNFLGLKEPQSELPLQTVKELFCVRSKLDLDKKGEDCELDVLEGSAESLEPFPSLRQDASQNREAGGNCNDYRTANVAVVHGVFLVTGDRFLTLDAGLDRELGPHKLVFNILKEALVVETHD